MNVLSPSAPSRQAGGVNIDGCPSFLADRMLGKLARWLRIMGYDTEYANEMDDDGTIAGIAADQGRILLTRDRNLHSRKGVKSIYISAVEIGEQLRTVVSECGLAYDENRMRCSLCNGVISITGREEVSGLVESGILARHDHFYVCGTCGKIYWRGSHWARISGVIDVVLARGK